MQRGSEREPMLPKYADEVQAFYTNAPVGGTRCMIRFLIYTILLLLLGGLACAFYFPFAKWGLGYGFLGFFLALGLLVMLLLRRICFCCRDASPELQYGEPSVKTLPTFKDEQLLARAWAVSPYSPDAIFYQPIEGYCGQATLNTVLWSLSADGRPSLLCPLAKRPRPYTLGSMAALVTDVVSRSSDLQSIISANSGGIQVVSGGCSLADFVRVLREAANDPRSRLLCNFHRTPLFYAQLGPLGRFGKIYNGHWSPIGALIEHNAGSSNEEEADRLFALVIDVNASFGSYLVSARRLWAAVHTRDASSSDFRGLIRLNLSRPVGRAANSSNGGAAAATAATSNGVHAAATETPVSEFKSTN